MLVVGALVAFTAVTVIRGVLPARTNLRATGHMLAEQQAENDGLRRAIDERAAEAEALETDAWLLRRILHDEFRITDENEVIVR